MRRPRRSACIALFLALLFYAFVAASAAVGDRGDRGLRERAAGARVTEHRAILAPRLLAPHHDSSSGHGLAGEGGQGGPGEHPGPPSWTPGGEHHHGGFPGDHKPGPPGQSNGTPPGQSTGSPPDQSQGTPPGQGHTNGTPPGHGHSNGTPPDHGHSNGTPPDQSQGTPPGEGGGTPPTQGNGTSPGQGGTPPGQQKQTRPGQSPKGPGTTSGRCPPSCLTVTPTPTLTPTPVTAPVVTPVVTLTPAPVPAPGRGAPIPTSPIHVQTPGGTAGPPAIISTAAPTASGPLVLRVPLTPRIGAAPVLAATTAGVRAGTGASGPAGREGGIPKPVAVPQIPTPVAAGQPSVVERIERVVPAWVWIGLGGALWFGLIATGAALVSAGRARRESVRVAAMSTAALIDPLTGALNRRGFTEALERELARARRYNRNFVLAFVDVRGLKAVNDTQGHRAGDQVIREAVALLKDSARANDVVGRLGGDELALLLVEVGQRDADVVVRRVHENVTDRRAKLGLKTPWDLTVGTAGFPEDGETFDELLRAADLRLYEQRGIELQ